MTAMLVRIDLWLWRASAAYRRWRIRAARVTVTQFPIEGAATRHQRNRWAAELLGLTAAEAGALFFFFSRSVPNSASPCKAIDKCIALRTAEEARQSPNNGRQ